MTKAELIEEVSRVVEMTRKDSEEIVETIFDSIVGSLHKGEKIEIRGFWQLPYPAAPAACRPQSQNRYPRGSSFQAHSVFQAEQGIAGHGEPFIQLGSRRERRALCGCGRDRAT